MCLTIPKQVLSINKTGIEVESSHGKERLASIIKVKTGDWILAQNNIIIKKITQKQAKEINNILFKNNE